MGAAGKVNNSKKQWKRRSFRMPQKHKFQQSQDSQQLTISDNTEAIFLPSKAECCWFSSHNNLLFMVMVFVCKKHSPWKHPQALLMLERQCTTLKRSSCQFVQIFLNFDSQCATICAFSVNGDCHSLIFSSQLGSFTQIFQLLSSTRLLQQ